MGLDVEFIDIILVEYMTDWLGDDESNVWKVDVEGFIIDDIVL